MNRRVVYITLTVLLGINLFFGAQIYVYSARGAGKDDPYESYRLLADVLERVRHEYVLGDKLSYDELIKGALKGMISNLDPHSELLEPVQYDQLKDDTEGQFGGLGIVVTLSKEKVLTVVSPMDNSPGQKAGIMPLDRIVKINGNSTEKLGLDDAVKLLRGKPGTDVSLTVFRPSNGQTKDFKLTRASIKVDSVKDLHDKQEFPVDENGVGYVKILQFGENTAEDLATALRKLKDHGMKGLILDLRGNPGGLLDQAEQVCEQFVTRGEVIVTTEGQKGVLLSSYRANGRGKRIDLPMVVLVNINSASAAEIVAGCLQDLQKETHAVVLGETTFGKGSVQTILPLSDGWALRLTTARYYTPSHKVIHEHGITPDIYVPMSEEEEYDLYLQHTVGAMENLEEKDRARVASVHDTQLERAEDLLKGVLINQQRNPASKVATAK